MPFVVRPAQATFIFGADSTLDGLEVTMSTRIGLADLVRMGVAQRNNDIDEVAQESDAIGKYLIAWNLEEPTEDGSKPVPATEEGWQSVEAVIKILVFRRWMDEINGKAGAFVDPKLPPPSRNGKRSPARSVATEAL
jgi:hypothetical protein